MRFNSPLVSQLRGSMGGVTATQGAAQQFLRAKVAPVVRKTAPQQLRRAQQTLIASTWKTLTPAQRLAWQVAAQSITVTNALGQPSHPSGFQHYVSVQRNLLLIGLAPTTKPVAWGTIFPSVIGTTCAAQVHNGVMAFLQYTLPAGPASGNKTYVPRASAPLSKGITPITRQSLRAIGHRVYAPGLSPNFAAGYVAFVPYAMAGQRINFSIQVYDNLSGQPGPEYRGSTVTVAV